MFQYQRELMAKAAGLQFVSPAELQEEYKARESANSNKDDNEDIEVDSEDEEEEQEDEEEYESDEDEMVRDRKCPMGHLLLLMLHYF